MLQKRKKKEAEKSSNGFCTSNAKAKILTQRSVSSFSPILTTRDSENDREKYSKIQIPKRF